MSKTIHEAPRDIPVYAEADVLVAGGGLSGFAAALAAARNGARTILLERNGCLGGVATATLMANIGNRFLSHSGFQSVRGIAAEVTDRLVKVGAASPLWKHRDVPGCVIDSERLKVVMIEMLEEAGVTIFTHALACRPVVEGHRVTGCFFESKTGRRAITARNTVDATGDLDLAVQTPADIVSHLGNGSLLFKLGGVDLDAFVEWLKKDPDGFPDGMDWTKDVHTFARNYYERGILFFPHYGGKNWRFLKEAVAKGEFKPKIDPAFNLDVLGMYALKGRGTVVINSNYYIFQSLDIRELSRYETHAQKMCYYVAGFLKDKVPGFQGSRVEHIGVDLGLRGSRYINGRQTLTEEHMFSETGPTRFDDVIAAMPKQKKDDAKVFFQDDVCEIPFGLTVPKGDVHNILSGSARSVSTEGGHKRLIRGMGGCMIIGQATGTAAALASKQHCGADELPIRDLQAQLLKDGVWLGDEMRLRELGLR